MRASQFIPVIISLVTTSFLAASDEIPKLNVQKYYDECGSFEEGKDFTYYGNQYGCRPYGEDSSSPSESSTNSRPSSIVMLPITDSLDFSLDRRPKQPQPYLGRRHSTDNEGASAVRLFIGNLGSLQKVAPLRPPLKASTTTCISHEQTSANNILRVENNNSNSNNNDHYNNNHHNNNNYNCYSLAARQLSQLIIHETEEEEFVDAVEMQHNDFQDCCGNNNKKMKNERNQYLSPFDQISPSLKRSSSLYSLPAILDSVPEDRSLTQWVHRHINIIGIFIRMCWNVLLSNILPPFPFVLNYRKIQI